MKLAIFDFDNTISSRDSFIAFLFFSKGFFDALIRFLYLSPVLVLYLFKVVSPTTTKELALTVFFKGLAGSELKQMGEHFAQTALPKIVKKSALEKIQWHKKQGDSLVVVSASLDVYLKEWCRSQQIPLIATQIEYNDGIVTGKLKTKNCYGPEKVRRLKENYNLNDFDFIYAYGDSQSDYVLAEIADEFQYRSFV